MFLTGMAANPILVKAASDAYGVELEFGWGRWALGAIVPGLLSLALLPLLLWYLETPTVRDARPAQARAREELGAMGPWTRDQLVMAGVFVLMLILWSTKAIHGMGTTQVVYSPLRHLNSVFCRVCALM